MFDNFRSTKLKWVAESPPPSRGTDLQGGNPHGKLGMSGHLTLVGGKFREIRKNQGKVTEIMVSVWCATAVAMATK